MCPSKKQPHACSLGYKKAKNKNSLAQASGLDTDAYNASSRTGDTPSTLSSGAQHEAKGNAQPALYAAEVDKASKKNGHGQNGVHSIAVASSWVSQQTASYTRTVLDAAWSNGFRNADGKQ